MPYNLIKAFSQSEYIQRRIIRYQGNLLTNIFTAVKQLAKGTVLLAYKMTLIYEKIQTLCKTNEAFTKRRRAKKIYIRAGRALSIQDTLDLIKQKEAIQQQPDKRSAEGDNVQAGLSGLRHYKRYSKAGHNVRICQEVEEISEEKNDVKNDRFSYVVME